MTPAELIARVQTLDRAYSQDLLRPDALVRIEAAIDRRSKATPPRDSWRIRFSTAMMMVMLGTFAVLAYSSVHPDPELFIVEGHDCVEVSGDQQAVLEVGCRLRIDGLTVESRGRGIIDFKNEVMVVRTGIFSFQAGKRRLDDPLEIEVSHGTVVVTGTRFTLRQRQSDGALFPTRGRWSFDILTTGKKGFRSVNDFDGAGSSRRCCRVIVKPRTWLQRIRPPP